MHHPAGDLHHARQTGAATRGERNATRHKEADIAQVNKLRRLSAKAEYAARRYDRSL
jgi:hypothetical protein